MKRSQKIGDRITALQKLASPYGKVKDRAFFFFKAGKFKSSKEISHGRFIRKASKIES